jgi:predicted amidohydrolase
MDVVFADSEANLRRMAEYVEQTSRAGAKLVVFPECALSGYCFEDLQEAMQFAEPIPGPGTQRIADVCRSFDCFVVFGMLEADADRCFNACVLVGPNGVIGSYRKIHLPFLGVDRFTTLGNRGFDVFEVGPARIGMHICYDGAFPEAARVMALKGADLVVLPTNWPPGAECTAAYVTNTRALENHVYFMAVNRVGLERGFRFIGGSKICDPTGATITEAAHERPEILYADLDLEKPRNKHLIRVADKHEIWRFADRRPEMYAAIIEPNRHRREKDS